MAQLLRLPPTLALPFCHVWLRAPKSKSSAYPQALKTLGDHLRKRRLDLGLLQVEVAGQRGVSPGAVRALEASRYVPRARFMPRLVRFLGYTPYTPAPTPGQQLRAARRALGLSQARLAELLGVHVDTVSEWERALHRPAEPSLQRLKALLWEPSPW